MGFSCPTTERFVTAYSTLKRTAGPNYGYGDRADFLWVEDNAFLEGVEGADIHINEPWERDFMIWGIGTLTDAGESDFEHGDWLDNTSDLPDAAFGKDFFHVIDVISQVAHYTDMDVDAMGDWSDRAAALDYELTFSATGQDGTWQSGALIEVFDDGWTEASKAEDYVARWQAPEGMQAKYVRIIAAGDGNTQIDAVIASKIEVKIEATDPAASELGPDLGEYTVTRLSGPIDRVLNVSYGTSGTAMPGDYGLRSGDDNSVLTGSVIIPAYEADTTIILTPVDDTLVEGPETATLTLLPGAGYAVGTPSVATVIIADYEPNQPPVLAAVGNHTVPEELTLSFQLNSSDADVPSQTLTYSVTNAPPGLTVTSSGWVSWTPTEIQGPDVYWLTAWVATAREARIPRRSPSRCLKSIDRRCSIRLARQRSTRAAW